MASERGSLFDVGAWSKQLTRDEIMIARTLLRARELSHSELETFAHRLCATVDLMGAALAIALGKTEHLATCATVTARQRGLGDVERMCSCGKLQAVAAIAETRA